MLEQKATMQSEFESNEKWYMGIDSSTQACKIIENKSVFHTKLLIDRVLDKQKFKVIVKRFPQIKGIDYTEIFNLVVKPTTKMIVLKLALLKICYIQQFDVNTTFLNGEIQEVYITQHKGFVNDQFPTYVCKLRKDIYSPL